MSQADTSAGTERSPEEAGGRLTGHPLTRRQALGRMSAVATAGAAAWVAPQILTAKPAAGAALSASPTPPGSSGSTGSGPSGSGATTSGSTSSGSTSSPVTNADLATNTSGSGSTEPATLASEDEVGSTLASTGANLERDAAIGAALVAGGWALHRWASRSPQVVSDAVEATAADPPQTA
jgi:hypothetical protein